MQQMNNPADRDEYRRRAGMADIHGGGLTPVAKIRAYRLDRDVVRYYWNNDQYTIEAEWENAGLASDPLTFVKNAWNVFDSGTGLRMRVREINYDRWENSMSAQGDIYDHHGEYVGHFQRTLHFDDLRIHHDLMTIREDKQRGGFGTRVYQNQEKHYERAGIQMVDMTAGLDRGGYAWARMGFDFANRRERDMIIKDLQDTWYRRYNADMPTRLRRALKHAWNIAMVVGPDHALLGKYIMMGSDWQAYKYLDGTWLGYKIGRRYYASRLCASASFCARRKMVARASTKTNNPSKLATATEGELLDAHGNPTGRSIFAVELENETETDKAWRESVRDLMPRVIWDPDCPERREAQNKEKKR